MPIINQRKNRRVLMAQATQAFTVAGHTLLSAIGRNGFTVPAPELNPQKREQAKFSARSHIPNNGGTNDPRYRERRRFINSSMLKTLSNSDPTTWSIKRAIKSTICMSDWHIIPDLDKEYEEIDRWFDLCQDSVNEWDYVVDFQSALIDPAIINPLRPEIKSIIKDTDLDARSKRFKLEVLFKCVKNLMTQQSVMHSHVVSQIFSRPNDHMETSLRALLELVVDDMLVYDSGVIVKNPNYYNELSELYTFSGEECRPMINEDRTVPRPPLPAYVQVRHGKVVGLYNNLELTNIVENPQYDGFGLSPVEALANIITLSMLGDTKYASNLMEGNQPPMVMNIGDVDEDMRQAFEDRLYDTIDETDGNRVVVVNSPNTEDGNIQVFSIPKGVDFRAAQIAEYRSGLEPSLKLFAFGLSADDFPLVGNQKAQAQDPQAIAIALADRRGIQTRMDLIEQFFNAEIVKQDYPFTDVKFKFIRSSDSAIDSEQAARADSIRIANGTMARNESRQKIKLRGIPGGDVATIVVGNQLVQVDSLEPSSEEEEFVFDESGNVVDGNGVIVATPAVMPGAEPVAGDEVQGDPTAQSLPNQQVKPNKPQAGAPKAAQGSKATRGKVAAKTNTKGATDKKVGSGE